MGIPTNEFGATFWLSAGAVVVGLVSLLAKFAYKSKCENVSLCFGLFKVHRNIEAEVKDACAEEPNLEKEETPKGNTILKIPGSSLSSRLQ